MSALAREDGLISTLQGGVTKEFLQTLYYNGNSFRDIVDWPPGTPAGERQPGNHGPHPEGERDGYVFMPYNTVVNAFHYHTLILMKEMARAINKMNEVRWF